jgi:arsenate reductase
MLKVYCYAKCSTCKKARAWLDAHGVAYDERHIVDHRPAEGELREWHAASGLPLRRFFNTSGMLYRQMALKDKLPNMTEDQMYELLASDGMLVKRPLLVLDETVLVGFREAEWEAALS